MKNNPVNTARELLLKWIASDEKKSYESIRKNCLYLDKSYSLNMDDIAIWQLFCPLVRTGVVDYAGNDYYAFANPVAILRNGIYLFTGLPSCSPNSTAFTGIFRSSDEDEVKGLKIIPFDGVSVLKNIPSVDIVVDSFNKTIADLSHAEFYHRKGKKGLTKRLDNGLVRYFCIPEAMYQREIPSRTMNPDAFSIAYNWSRSINKEISGVYSQTKMTLTMQSFALPIMIERVLFLECMTKGIDPIRMHKEITFPEITRDIANEINRILCNTIRYE